MTTPFEEFVALPEVQQVGEREALYENKFAGPHLLRVYYRFLEDGRVLLTHRSEESGTGDSLECARAILEMVETHIDSSWGEMRILPSLVCDLPHLDHVLTVPPIVHYSSFSKDDMRIVRQRLYCAPVNVCEFAEGETKPEFLGRKKNGFPFNQWNREPVPAVSTTFNITGSYQSKQRRPAVTRYSDLQNYVKLTGEKGGVVVMENYQRERCVFESDAPNSELAVVFRRKTHRMLSERALAFLDVLARQGGDAAEGTL